ncbi:hypothetical protein WJU23_03375 [Prosthecobacter sp. SYSU 5D2]|uniref:hypothetical protein n=1 Tax=Prosthecobacter sp. SYSU 5D2 TaxID=3134134 RepID=UPI0031FEB0E1
MEQQGVRLHETNEGRETQQGIAGFEGANAFYFMLALGLGLLLFRKFSEGSNPNMLVALGIASIPMLVVMSYVFGLKQGKPASYDIELGEWLIIKASANPYFSPRQVEPLSLPWVEDPMRKEKNQEAKKKEI